MSTCEAGALLSCRCTAVQRPCCSVGTPSTCTVGRSCPCTAGARSTKSCWNAVDHAALVVDRLACNLRCGVDVGVNTSDQVGSNAGGTSRQRGVIHVDGVGGVQARGLQSTAATGSSQGDVRGRRSSVMPLLATHMSVGGIALSYDYFKFTPDWISNHPPAGRSSQHPHVEGSHRAPAVDGRADVLRRRNHGGAAAEQTRAACGVWRHAAADLYLAVLLVKACRSH
ncbi:unnamed protein product [Closterium sp. NIES-54]